MASCSSTATTVESTPPDSPQITFAAPICSRSRAISASRKAAMVQLLPQPAILYTKFLSIAAPLGVCTTSGWNCTP